MLSQTQRTEIKKSVHKTVLDTQQLHAIIDESLLAHIAITEAHGPVVIPMLTWRVGQRIYIHGARNSRLIRQLKQGNSTCLTFTLFDGWVLARSTFHHSAHYRSAVVFGQFEEIEDNAEKDRLLNHFIEQIAPGRSAEARTGNEKELTATVVLSMPLSEASVKISCSDVNDDAADMDLPVWAGIVPYRTVVGPLVPSPTMTTIPETPDYSRAYGSRWVNYPVD